MSKAKKEMRAAKKARREAQQGRKVVRYVAGALILLMLVAIGMVLLI